MSHCAQPRRRPRVHQDPARLVLTLVCLVLGMTAAPGTAAGPSPFLLSRIVVGQLQANCYLLWHRDSLDLVIIDPGARSDLITRGITETGARPAAILLTHGHSDHLGAADDVARTYGCPIYAHPADHSMAQTNGLSQVKPLRDGEELQFGEIRLTVLHVPGHSPGGVGFLLAMSGEDAGTASATKNDGGAFLFSGDILFAEGIGRTWQDGDEEILLAGIQRAFGPLPPKTMVLPGHGPPATMGTIRGWLDEVTRQKLGQ